MSDAPHDNCDSCHQDYPLTADNSQLNLFIRTPKFHHIIATCPHCQMVTRMYLTIDATCAVLAHLPINVFEDAPDEVVAGWHRVNACPPDSSQPQDVFISPRRIRQLERDLEAFEHGVDG